MTAAAFSLDELRDMMSGRLGTRDLPCPACSPGRSTPKKRALPVLRIWQAAPDFATFNCMHCGLKGEAHAGRGGARFDHEAIRRARAEAAARDREAAAKQQGKAQWFWGRRAEPRRSIVETYLREIRGYTGPIPATLAYLPPRGEHGPAMIAAYGLPIEPEPGLLMMPDQAVVGVQFTNLLPDGHKAPDSAKISLGRSQGWPIILAPMNDLLGLAITEGAEDALSVAEATGLGAWAAGGASRMPALAETVPFYTGCVNVLVDDDPAGRRYSAELIACLKARHLDVESINLNTTTKAA